MRTTDNNCGVKLDDLDQNKIKDLEAIADRSLSDLLEEESNLIAFPHSLIKDTENKKKSSVFSLKDSKLTTYNLMGFIGYNNTELTITSRFASGDHNDYFLHYMLQKVFSINLLDFTRNSNQEDIWDFYKYLFPYLLKKAYTQGIFRTYKRMSYNDSNVKGTIDIKQHLLKNIPFSGKIAYNTREYSYDNPITQLIRHTIEFLKADNIGSKILSSNGEIRDIVNHFIFVTNKTYNKGSKQKIISKNLKPVSHPYYTEYSILQNICLKILRHEKFTFGKDKDKVYGILFDGAWLWEEYLTTLLIEKFNHPNNIKKTGAKYLFRKNKLENGFQAIYPDFISKEEPYIIGDAKYSRLNTNQSYYDNERSTSIYYKTIAYMYRFNSIKGFLLYPYNDSSKKEFFIETYNIMCTNGVLQKIGFYIPQSKESFSSFVADMKEKEEELLKTIEKLEKFNTEEYRKILDKSKKN